MRIKVTGYIDASNLPEDWIDAGHPMGLSEKGYENLPSELPLLEEIETEVE